MTSDDLERCVVVRVADEIVIDLMKSVCGVTYSQASQMIGEVEIDGARGKSLPYDRRRDVIFSCSYD